ncbi:hypothetical protein AB0L40_06145 [Patulibacter sp. NPDC049589]|uniref:hypothetical protein n=1 Tax=Patulibacter sp. NPDC049589 TaxID=3154731 RepID=UPI0034282A80
MPPTDTAGPVPALHACADCESPLQAGQRYCIVCGAPNRAAEDPAARYLAAASQRRRPVAAAPRRKGVGIGTAAVLAALPLAVGIGVIAGRSGDDGDLAAALRKQQPTVVNVGGGAGAGGTATTAAGADAAAGAKQDAKADPKADAEAKKRSEAVVGSGAGGKAHSVEHHVSTATTKARDKAVVRKLNQETGKSYVESQRNLPDVIEVQPDPDAGPPATPQSAGQP